MKGSTFFFEIDFVAIEEGSTFPTIEPTINATGPAENLGAAAHFDQQSGYVTEELTGPSVN